MTAEKLVEKAEWLQPPCSRAGGRQLAQLQLSPGQLGATGLSSALRRGDSVNAQLEGFVSLFSLLLPPSPTPHHQICPHHTEKNRETAGGL